MRSPTARINSQERIFLTGAEGTGYTASSVWLQGLLSVLCCRETEARLSLLRTILAVPSLRSAFQNLLQRASLSLSLTPCSLFPIPAPRHPSLPPGGLSPAALSAWGKSRLSRGSVGPWESSSKGALPKVPMKGLLTPAGFPSFPVSHVAFPGGEQRRSRGVKRPLGREGGSGRACSQVFLGLTVCFTFQPWRLSRSCFAAAAVLSAP